MNMWFSCGTVQKSQQDLCYKSKVEIMGMFL